MPIQRSYFPILIFVALEKVAGGIDGVDNEIRRKKLHNFLYKCIMHTIEYQSHLEQNFAHYTLEITVVEQEHGGHWRYPAASPG